MAIDNIDRTSMSSMVNGFPQMVGAVNPSTDAIESAKDTTKGVCVLGMGGSAIAGEICKGLYSERAPIPITCVRDYALPKYVDSDWSVIAVSYSGNTEETLSAFAEAIKRGIIPFVISSGGKLMDLADPKRFSRLPDSFQPRAALPLILSVELPLIETLIGQNRTNLIQIGKKLADRKKEWTDNGSSPNQIARRLSGKIPLFIGSGHLQAAAYRAKCQINENAKIASFHSILPEANHNEIESVGWFASKDILPVFLRSEHESPRIRKRIEATSEIYFDEGVDSIHLNHANASKLEEILLHIYHLDLVSMEIALKQGVDAVAVERIARLKRILSQA
ncbi:MAG: bifunctional phosphoglucose/phosphomannose isomerase [Candidatus Thorarchaeota archaeon]|nr:bifunctional phosphoglucose/phosphomannose isomerase [Candidatus Thorarchaeota archaeon]